MENFKNNKNIFWTAVIIIVTAFFSSGFLHPDEHYQILELLQLKISSWPRPDLLNWDFHEKIRPWFQTYVYYLLTKILFLDDPYIIAFIIRVFNGVLGIVSVRLLLNEFDSKNKNSLLIYFLLWFVPFLFVRTNSESLSTSLFLFGAYFHHRGNKVSNKMISGILFGASFLARYQMGVPVFFVNIWELFKKKNYKEFIVHSIFIGIAIIIGIIVDYWGYGTFNLSFWNYFRENILHSRASGFGTSPFYYYFFMPIFKGGVLIPLVICYGIYRYHREHKLNFWVIAFWSFFIIHSLIPHKEVRFITFNFLIGSLMALPYISELLRGKYSKIFKSLIVLNFLIMIRTSLFPANSYMNLYKYMYDNKIDRIGVYTDQADRHFGFSMPFYQRDLIKTFGVVDAKKLNAGFYLSTKYKEYDDFASNANCVPKFKSYPNWITFFNIGNWLSRSSYFVVWKCD
ncbi:mannosyltransferase [Bacteriovorax sp. Seq25_V]|uniref:mannosyltransferase n=1 Tax=Bacteriovorax sp. Seq25_V TaxID=1201288 RepID=UPI00038A2AA1|nr:mannosyltransferase [Bacteriovorax sp. Seq25_V]EQC43419.1 Alg9-like mannosyltransferase family protein [Bacteriovorax sp. Seq25_V]